MYCWSLGQQGDFNNYFHWLLVYNIKNIDINFDELIRNENARVKFQVLFHELQIS